MSGIPPVIPSDTTKEGLSTPAHEWASKTTSALDPGSGSSGTAGTLNPTTEELQSSHGHTHTTTLPPTSNEGASQPPILTQNLTSSSTASTPGVNIPGAFREDKDAQGHVNIAGTASSISQTVQATAQKAGETAAQYLPKSVVDTVAQYMPSNKAAAAETVSASSHDVPHKTSLPSTEVTGTSPGEHVSGVGSLPGVITETSVGKLPDERSEIDQFASTKPIETSDTTKNESSGGYTAAVGGAAAGAAATIGGAYEAVKNKVSGTTSQEPTTSLPSSESTGAQPFEHTSGVGALPGNVSERGVARLPDEPGRKEELGIGAATDPNVGTHARTFDAKDTDLPSQEKEESLKTGLGGSGDMSREPVGSSKAHASGGVGALPGGVGEEGVAKLPDERAKESTENAPKKAFSTGSAIAAGAGAGGIATLASQSKDEKDASRQRRPSTGEAGTEKSKLPGKEKDVSTRRASEGAATRSAGGAGVAGITSAGFAGVQKETQTVGKDESDQKVAKPSKSNKDAPYESNYHPAELHPLDKSKEASKPTEAASEGHGAGESEQATGAKSKEAAASHEKAKKVSFMEKMKGEAKILLGKVEGKKGEAKVEEGRKILKGESATSSPTSATTTTGASPGA
ncbi:hypothetical protein ABKN59_010553 [Abortiporus biennis]